MMFFLLRRARPAALFVVVASALSGCMSVRSYVDPTLAPISKAQIQAPATPGPVSVLFEFRAMGNANARGTSALQGRVIAAVAESGVFSNVSSVAGLPDAGILKIIIDNVGNQGNAAAKGFGTGLTLGLVGSMVKDGYICTASYTYKSKVFETTQEQAIFSTVGNHVAPKGMTASSPQDAVNQVVDQLVWHSLKDLAEKHAFNRE